MKISFFKQGKSRRFNYTPRYFKGKDELNKYDFGSLIEKSRDTSNINDFGTHWSEARKLSRNRKNSGISYTIVIIFLILLLFTFGLLGFDLSIFK